MQPDRQQEKEAAIIEEMLALLQEKRTSLKTIRVGIAMVLAQLSLAGFLVAYSRSRLAALPILHSIALLSAFNLLVFGVALFLVVRPIARIRRANVELHHYQDSLCALGRCDI